MTEFRMRTSTTIAACTFLLLASCPFVARSQQASRPGTPMPSIQLPPTPTGPALQSVQKLTLADAERMAMQHNPNISVAKLLALAQEQVTREVRSAELPMAVADLTTAGAHQDSRITAGALNNPSVFDRVAGGMSVSQFITDFGRTRNLMRSAQSNARAQMENERATGLEITLTVDEAFFQALTAQAVLKVAWQTLNQRQATADQVGALERQKLRSDLDLSFANVQNSQAKLFLLDAQNNSSAAMANLNAVLGSEKDQQFDLVDDITGNPEAPPQDAEALLKAAFAARPDLAALNDNYTSARQFSSAEHELWMPTVFALAAGGATPVRADQILSSWYGAAGANIRIPVFNGFLYSARAKEATLRANAAGEQVRNLRETIARDMRTAVLNAQNAFQRIGVTQELLNDSNMALDLAQQRYKIGLSGIVDLTQAQLEQTQAEIAYADARYAYQSALAVVRFQTGQ